MTSSDSETTLAFTTWKAIPAANRATPKMIRAVMISLSCLPEPVSSASSPAWVA